MDKIYIESKNIDWKSYVKASDFRMIIRWQEKENNNLRDWFKVYRKKFDECLKDYREILRDYGRQEEDIKKLKNKNKKLKEVIEYWKKKAEKNQEKADFVDKVMKLPWVMENWKINRTKVALYYTI